MASPNGEIQLYQSDPRAIFPLDGFHVSRSLARRIKRGEYRVTFDQDFEHVIRGCLRPFDNWLNEEIIQAFLMAHRLGWAHSAECWREGILVGGVYGIAVGGCFSAESMFHRATDASKVALHAMIARCGDLGFALFDAQVMNEHLRSLGAIEIDAAEFSKMQQSAHRVMTPWSAPPFR